VPLAVLPIFANRSQIGRREIVNLTATGGDDEYEYVYHDDVAGTARGDGIRHVRDEGAAILIAKAMADVAGRLGRTTDATAGDPYL
jgi:hypothetical protein